VAADAATTAVAAVDIGENASGDSCAAVPAFLLS